MDREQLERQLAVAEKSVALGYELIAEQRLVVTGLEAWGHDAGGASDARCFRNDAGKTSG